MLHRGADTETGWEQSLGFLCILEVWDLNRLPKFAMRKTNLKILTKRTKSKDEDNVSALCRSL